MFVQMSTHDWIVSSEDACVCNCPTGSMMQLWGASKVSQLCPSPVSHMPVSAIKVRQSSTLASLYLWHYTAPRLLARLHYCPSLPLLAPRGICHSPVISFINSWLPPTFSHWPGRRREWESSERKWWPLCPSSRFSCCDGWHISEVLTDSSITLKQVSASPCCFIAVLKKK